MFLYKGSQNKDLASIYSRCAEEFSDRQLSKENHALKALTGISNHISSRYATPMIFELHSKPLLYGLTRKGHVLRDPGVASI